MNRIPFKKYSDYIEVFGLRIDWTSFGFILIGLFVSILGIYKFFILTTSQNEYTIYLNGDLSRTFTAGAPYTVQLGSSEPVYDFAFNGVNIDIDQRVTLDWPWADKVGYVSQQMTFSTPLAISQGESQKTSIGPVIAHFRSEVPFQLGRSSLDRVFDVILGIVMIAFLVLIGAIVWSLHLSIGRAALRRRASVPASQ